MKRGDRTERAAPLVLHGNESGLPAWARGALAAGPGHVDREPPAARLVAVEGLDGLVGLVVVVHLHEAEAAGAAGLAVHDHLGRTDCAEGLESTKENYRRVVDQGETTVGVANSPSCKLIIDETIVPLNESLGSSARMLPEACEAP